MLLATLVYAAAPFHPDLRHGDVWAVVQLGAAVVFLVSLHLEITTRPRKPPAMWFSRSIDSRSVPRLRVMRPGDRCPSTDRYAMSLVLIVSAAAVLPSLPLMPECIDALLQVEPQQ